jgi:Fe-S-cluster-containing dehydrogenase component
MGCLICIIAVIFHNIKINAWQIDAEICELRRDTEESEEKSEE